MSILKEFQEFAVKGNAVDLAIGVIIGAAFGKIVSSLVSDVIMPPLGLLLGGIDFNHFAYTLKGAVSNQPAVQIKYGNFINNVIDFLIVAIVIFLVVKGMNRLRSEPAPKVPDTKECPECQMSIPIKAHRCGHCGMPVSI